MPWLTINWIIFGVASILFACGMLVAINGSREFNGRLVLKKGASVEISAFRFFATPLQIDVVIGTTELDKRRKETDITSFPTGCGSSTAHLNYAQEINDTIRLEIFTNPHNERGVFFDSPAHDSDSHSSCGVLGTPNNIVKTFSFNETLSEISTPDIFSKRGWSSVMLDSGFSTLIIKVVEVGPILNGDQSEIIFPGPVGLKGTISTNEWQYFNIFSAWPAFTIFYVIWLVILIRMTRKHA